MWDLIASVPDHCLSFYFDAVCLLFFSDILNQHYLFCNISDGAAIEGATI